MNLLVGLHYVRDGIMSDAGVRGLSLSVRPVGFEGGGGATLLQLKDALIMRLCRLPPSLSLSVWHMACISLLCWMTLSVRVCVRVGVCLNL